MTLGVLSVYSLIQNEMILGEKRRNCCHPCAEYFRRGGGGKSLYHHFFPAFPLVFPALRGRPFINVLVILAVPARAEGRLRKIQFQALEWMV